MNRNDDRAEPATVTGRAAHARAGPRSAFVTALQDIGWLLLVVLPLPLWIAMLLGSAAVMGARQLYWWIRGNTTAASRTETGRPATGMLVQGTDIVTAPGRP